MYHVSRILSAFLTYVLVLLRCGCVVVFAPFFSSEVFSSQVRIYFAMAFPLLFLPVASRTAEIPAAMDMTHLAILAGQEFALGMAIAYLGTLVFTAIQFAGEIAGQQIGFSMASVMDPQTGMEMPMLGFINMNLGIVSFVVAKLHIVYIYIMLKSYEYVGIGGLTPDLDMSHPVLAMALLQISTLIRLGLQMAGPIVLIMLLTSVAEGFVTKTMPQMNIQVFGMPIKVAVGLTALVFLYPALCAVLIPPGWRLNLSDMPDGPFGEMLGDLSRMVAEMGRGSGETGSPGAF
jgi:flagellar biosynthetic protein FliR